MEALVLSPRTGGKAKQLRAQGFVPIGYVVRGKPTMLYQAPEDEVRRAIGALHGAGMLKIKIEGDSKTHHAVVKMMEDSIIGRQIESVVLMDVAMNEELVFDVPVDYSGTPEPVAEGTGIVATPTTHVKLKGIGSEIPSTIRVNIGHLQIGEHVEARHLVLPAGIELVSSPEATLFAVHVKKAAVEDVQDEAITPAEDSVAADGGTDVESDTDEGS